MDSKHIINRRDFMQVAGFSSAALLFIKPLSRLGLRSGPLAQMEPFARC